MPLLSLTRYSAEKSQPSSLGAWQVKIKKPPEDIHLHKWKEPMPSRDKVMPFFFSGISPAATLNPYIWLFGFVDAAGLIPSLNLIEAPSSIDDKVSGAYFFLRNQTSGTYPDLAFNYGQLLAISQAGTTFQFLFPVTWECKIYYRLYMEGAWKAWKILLG